MGDYSSGPVGLLIAVQNVGSKPQPVVLHVQPPLVAVTTPPQGRGELEGRSPSNGNGAVALPITKELLILPNTTMTIPLNDLAGVGTACEPRPYKLWLTGDAAETTMRSARITPMCSFTAVVENTYSQLAPDHWDYVTANNAFVSGSKLVAPYTCGPALALEVTVVNGASKKGENLIVDLLDVDGTSIGKRFVNVPPGKSATTTINAYPKGLPGTMRLHLDDPNKSLAPGHPVDSDQIKVTRTCTLTASPLE